MDWKIFFGTFILIFFAEIADKTQLAAIGMSTKSNKPIVVLLGSISAYTIVTIISVLIGTMLGKYIKEELVRYIGALLFIVIGILMFMKKI